MKTLTIKSISHSIRFACEVVAGKPGTFLLTLLLSGSALSSAAQTISASAGISGQPAGVNLFNYTITLNNSASSSSSIGTFWYAWLPGQDYLPSSPSLVTPPTGWTDTITHFGVTDGYAIEFFANGPADALAPGQSLDFNFETLDSPAALAGNSPYYPTIPVGTSMVYGGGPFSLPSDQFVVQSVPEPSGFGFCLLGTLSLLVVGSRRRCSPPRSVLGQFMTRN
ncbi:MAG TPA: hypothetical protein VL361_27930 [Candidatus Limnocylindrales bacterium]|jgi:hypothetical protein|nr:hypothetical protein [Candidatus Limnocylindrales bacterium]